MDRTFDRQPRFDERSRNYPIRALLGTPTLRSYTWDCKPRLNQGSEGACVGFGWAHELSATPVVVRNVTNNLALSIYHQAQTLDEWPGENYDGTSVLGGAKAVQAMGHMPQYRWAFSLDDVLLTLGNYGPVVLGMNWYEGMVDTDASGFIRPTGKKLGGHCILARGVAISRGYVTLRNSWGAEWGLNGDCRIKFADLAALLGDSGEACVPVRRA